GMDQPERAHRLPHARQPDRAVQRFLREHGVGGADLDQEPRQRRELRAADEAGEDVAGSAERRHQRLYALRMLPVGLEDHLRAHRMSEQPRPLEPRPRHDRPEVARALGDGQLLGMLGHRRPAVAAVVPGDEGALRREVLGQPPPEERRDADAVGGDQGGGPLAVRPPGEHRAVRRLRRPDPDDRAHFCSVESTIRNSTLRLSDLPALVAFEAIGRVGPYPTAKSCFAFTPWLTRNSLTESARDWEIFTLLCTLPTLSVWPSTRTVIFGASLITCETCLKSSKLSLRITLFPGF